MIASGGQPLLTLEPFIDAVRAGIEDHGWALSGLQKTTSHRFEGRWSGDETRSAYLFFHDDSELPVSVDVYLDETSRGLTGNLALVVDLRTLSEVGDTADCLSRLGRAAAATLPSGYRAPLTLRHRLPDGMDEPGAADVEVRFKLMIPAPALQAGASAVTALCSTTVRAFARLVEHESVLDVMDVG